jgi:hypothetical protein
LLLGKTNSKFLPKAASEYLLSSGGCRNYFEGHMRLPEPFYRGIGGFLNTATSSLREATEMIFRIDMCFRRSKTSDYEKAAKKKKNHQRT